MATYSISDADKWLGLVATNYRAAALRGLYSAALRLQSHITTEVIPAVSPEPTARGAYKAAWRAARLPNGAEVVNTLFYAILIEKGVRPENVKVGRKLIEALIEWIHLKGIGANVTTDAKGRRVVTKPGRDEQERIAWAIARSMQKHGIFNRGKGWNVLGTAVKMAPKYIREEVLRELHREWGQ